MIFVAIILHTWENTQYIEIIRMTLVDWKTQAPPWLADRSSLRVKFPIIQHMRELEIWGEIKRTAREFRCTSYLHRGCIMVVELLHSWRTEARYESNYRWFRAWVGLEIGGKERGRWGVPIYLLLAPRMHHGGRAYPWLADRSSVWVKLMTI